MADYEDIFCHAKCSRDRAIAALITDGCFSAVSDLTKTQSCDELEGRALSTEPTRLDVAMRSSIPQVAPVDALNMVYFDGLETAPEQFKERYLNVRNAQVTLTRITVEECGQLGEIITNELNQLLQQHFLFCLIV